MWAFAIAAAQFGYEEWLTPWQDYCQQRIISIRSTEAFGQMQAESLRKNPLPKKYHSDNYNTVVVSRILSNFLHQAGQVLSSAMEHVLQVSELNLMQLLNNASDDTFEMLSQALVEYGEREVSQFRDIAVETGFQNLSPQQLENDI